MTPRAVATGPAASSSKSAGERLVLQLFRRPFLSEEAAAHAARKANAKIGAAEISRVDTEQCFNVETTEALSADEMTTLQWLLRETFEPDLFASSSAFADVSARASSRLALGWRSSPRGPPTPSAYVATAASRKSRGSNEAAAFR